MKGYRDHEGRQAPERNNSQGSTSTQAVPTRSSLSLINVIQLRARDDMKVEPK